MLVPNAEFILGSPRKDPSHLVSLLAPFNLTGDDIFLPNIQQDEKVEEGV